MSDLREAAKASLAAMQDVLESAYHRCYPECCGRAGMECCGQPLQAWSPDDQHIMDTLGPVEKDLRAALAADAERLSVPIDCERFACAPCYLCGYNGAGYYQPAMHPCAKLFHAAAEKEPRK